MSAITLKKPSQPEVTVLSNIFIDFYMPEANGEFVKVYIYLLRTLSSAPVSFTLEEMADRLLCTERDILRALKYWSKCGLLSMEYSGEQELQGIVLLAPEPPEKEKEIPDSPESRGLRAVVAPAEESRKPSPVNDGNGPKMEAVSENRSSSGVSSRALTPDRVQELKQNEEIVQLLYIAEQYLGKTLSSTEVQKILFFYDELKLSADLIEYLIEYCVSRNHRSMRYIETVALSWAQEGITTVEMAKESSSRYHKDYYTILKSFGITGRSPVETEISLMDTWLRDYEFTMDIILEAVSRTVLQTGQPSFQYADKILTGWKKKNVRSLNDVRVLDAEHKKRRLEKTVNRQSSPPASNRFNNFQQRTYNFEEYEKQLLNQS